MLTVRIATTADLDAVAALLCHRRRQFERWSPRWWRAAAGADEMHRLWLRYLIETDGPVVLVAEDEGGVVGCVVVSPQAWGTFVDDWAVSDDHDWADVGAALLGAVDARPSRACVPAADGLARAVAAEAGMALVSSYWVAETATTAPTAPAGAAGAVTAPLPVAPVPTVLPPAAPHTFGHPFEPDAVGALLVADERGVVVGSPPISAPPVYDPGGRVAIVDRLHGPDRETVVAAAREAARARGDVLVAIVALPDDGALASALDAAGFERVVDVYEWA